MGIIAWAAKKAFGAVANTAMKTFGNVFGEVATQAVTTVTKVVDTSGNIIKEVVNDPGDVAKAREFGAVQADANPGYLRRFADGVNMCIRPGLVIALSLIIAGVVEAPDLTGLDETYVRWFDGVMIFYFGQRAVVYDVPRLIANFKKALGK